MRAKAAAALIAGAAIAALLILRSGGERFSYDGPEAPAFSFSYEEMEQGPLGPGELVNLSGGEIVAGYAALSLVGEPLRFRPSAEPVGGSLPLAADRFERRLRRNLPGFRLLEEGRTRLEVTEGIEAYQLGFTAKATRPDPNAVTPASGDPGTGAMPATGPIVIGKTYLIPPDVDGADRGVALTILERTDEEKILAAVREQPAGFFLNWPIRFWLQQATAVETPTALEKPVESFGFD